MPFAYDRIRQSFIYISRIYTKKDQLASPLYSRPRGSCLNLFLHSYQFYFSRYFFSSYRCLPEACCYFVSPFPSSRYSASRAPIIPPCSISDIFYLLFLNETVCKNKRTRNKTRSKESLVKSSLCTHFEFYSNIDNYFLY